MIHSVHDSKGTSVYAFEMLHPVKESMSCHFVVCILALLCCIFVPLISNKVIDVT